jgi:uncharacterized phage protein gp47/JayE
MWFERSLDATGAAVRAAFRQYLPGTDAAPKNSFVTVIGKVVALVANELELRIAAILPQLFLSTATGVWLERHCAEIGITRRSAASASGTLTATGTASATYAAGVRFSIGTVIYESTAPATADGSGNLSIPVTATTKGVDTNRDAGATLSLLDPLSWPGLSATAAVASGGLGGGANTEGDTSLRARGLQRKANPPQGGALPDYERIALAVPGVLKAWAWRVPASPGSVLVHFLFEGRTNYIPEAGDVTAVQAAIDAARLIRVDDSVAAAPVAQDVDVTITGLSTDNSVVRAAIEASIRAMFLARCRPGITGDNFTVSRSWISEAISIASGEERHVLTLPAADITLTGGAFPVLGTVTYA